MDMMSLPANIHEMWLYALETWQQSGYEHGRPSAVFKPTLTKDGNQWCALYGEDLMSGIAGFGDSPAAAMAVFDKAWTSN